MNTYMIATAVIGLSGGAGAALVLETTRRRAAGLRLEREIQRPPPHRTTTRRSR